MKNIVRSKSAKNVPETVSLPVSGSPLPDIGASLRARRRLLGLSIVEVAQQSELSIGYISLLERNLASPSLTALMRIGEALGLSLDYFLHMPEAGGHHFPKSARTPFQLQTGGMQFDRISGQFPGSVMNTLVVTIPPKHKANPVTHAGEELVYVISGSVHFNLGSRKIHLEVGDSVHLPSTTPHGWENPFSKEAKVLWVGTVLLFKHDDESGDVGNDLQLHGSPTGVYAKAATKATTKGNTKDTTKPASRAAPKRKVNAGVS